MTVATQSPVRSNVSFKSTRSTMSAKSTAAAKKPVRSFIDLVLKALSAPAA